MFKTLFIKVNSREVMDEKRIDKVFTIADLNSDNKLSLHEFIKIVEDFLDPNYLGMNWSLNDFLPSLIISSTIYLDIAHASDPTLNR